MIEDLELFITILENSLKNNHIKIEENQMYVKIRMNNIINSWYSLDYFIPTYLPDLKEASILREMGESEDTSIQLTGYVMLLNILKKLK